MPRSQEEMIVHTLCIALRLAFKYLYATRLAKVSVLSFTPTALNNTFMLYLKGGKKVQKWERADEVASTGRPILYT